MRYLDFVRYSLPLLSKETLREALSLSPLGDVEPGIMVALNHVVDMNVLVGKLKKIAKKSSWACPEDELACYLEKRLTNSK